MVQVVVIKTAVAGIGPYNRKWPGPPETADRYGLSCCKMHCCGAVIQHIMHTTVVAAQWLLCNDCCYSSVDAAPAVAVAAAAAAALSVFTLYTASAAAMFVHILPLLPPFLYI